MLGNIFSRVAEVFGMKRPLNEDFFEELEEALVASDVSVRTTMSLIEYLKEKIRIQRLREVAEAKAVLKERIVEILTKSHFDLAWPTTTPGLFLMVGVNGTGKTTSIAKLTRLATAQGKKVLLAAGDTFRAAASEQLEIWGERLGVPVIRGRDGGDPAAVIFDSLQAAQARGVDLVIADTAGRLHTKHNLMQELGKIYRVGSEKLGHPPDEVLLVVDATTGQNALMQAKEFQQVVNLTGVVLTKLDSTAKGGIVITIADELGLPIKCIGTGEQPGDFQAFSPGEFADTILGNNTN